MINAYFSPWYRLLSVFFIRFMSELVIRTAFGQLNGRFSMSGKGFSAGSGVAICRVPGTCCHIKFHASDWHFCRYSFGLANSLSSAWRGRSGPQSSYMTAPDELSCGCPWIYDKRYISSYSFPYKKEIAKRSDMSNCFCILIDLFMISNNPMNNLLWERKRSNIW